MTVEELVAFYTHLETVARGIITERLTMGEGLALTEWVTFQTAENRQVRTLLRELVNSTTVRQREAAFSNLIATSWLDGSATAYRQTGRTPPLQPPVRVPTGVKTLQAEQQLLLAQTRSGLVTEGTRAHRQAVSEVAGLVQTNTITRTEAVRVTTRRLNEQQITPFIDKAGKKWTTRNYVEMATKTLTHRANVTGRVATFKALDEYFVIVSGHAETCDQCEPWQNEILDTRNTAHPPAIATVTTATTAGLLHPRCSHTLDLYLTEENNTATSVAETETSTV